MFDKNFLKKIWEQKEQYQDFKWSNLLQLQDYLRKKVNDQNIAKLITEWIINEKKFEKKFPKLIQSKGLLWGSVCEQATDEAVANHKAGFFKGEKFLDLTAGLAIDTFAFAKNFQTVYAVEQNKNLIPFLQFNAERLNITNVYFIINSSEKFLENNHQQFDLIYLDPSRKINQKKVYHPKDCSPNVFEILPLLFSFTKTILIKLSPMIEIHELFHWFQNMEWIWVISKDNECKELLVLLNKEFNQQPQFRVSIIKKNDAFVYELNSSQNFSNSLNEQDLEKYHYVLLPDVTFTKIHFLNYLQSITEGLLTSSHDGILLFNKKLGNYYGRIKKIIKIMGISEFSAYQKQKGLWNATVIKKHFPLKVEEIRKKWKISEGTSDHFIFIHYQNENKVIHCKEEEL